MKKFRILFAVALVLLLTQACDKDEISINDDVLIDQESLTEQTMFDLDGLIDEALGLRLFPLKSATIDGYYYMNDCPVVTVNLTATPKVVTMDFGTGCKGKDGKTRSGKILVTSTTLENFNVERVKTFENFFIEGKKIEGKITKKITIDREDHTRLANVKEDVTITFPDNGGKATRKSDMTREYQLFILGWNKDNVMKSWGTSEFTRANGIKVTKTIAETNPLVFKMECHQMVSGVVTFTTSDNRTWSIDYGKGDCDNKAVVTKNGETKEINLRK
jgi:hypothetical protein